MKRYVLAMLVLALFAIPGYCQNNQPPASDSSTQAGLSQTAAPEVASAPAEKTIQPQEVSIYGEVKAVNTAAGSVTVQYYDYDSDEEKTIEIVSDNSTKLENAATINDVKQGNWADVIYTTAGGKNTAKSIIVEKEEEAPPAEMPKVEETPVPQTSTEMPKQ